MNIKKIFANTDTLWHNFGNTFSRRLQEPEGKLGQIGLRGQWEINNFVMYITF